MDPREYAWQMGDLAADPYMSPDERYNQPPPKDAAWPQQFLPSPGDPAPWKAQPTSLARWPVDPSQMSANEAAAFQTQSRYRNPLTRDPASNQMGALAEMVAPQSPLDYALLGAGPIAKAASVPVRGAIYGGALALDPGKAEAMLAGPRSKTANLALYNKAMDMLIGGRKGPEIRKETNWFPIDTRGNLAYEISDKSSGWLPGQDPSKIPMSAFTTPSGEHAVMQGPAGRTYGHPAAYEAYPDLANTPLVIDPRQGKGVQGGFLPPEYVGDQPKAYLTPASSGQMRSVLMHELFGHGVQNLEQGQTPAGQLTGWSIGGNPNLLLRNMKEGTPQYELYQRMLSDVRKHDLSFDEYAAMLKGTGLEATEKQYKNFLQNTKFGVTDAVDERLRAIAAHKAYRMGSGEEMARAIQARMNFGPRKIQQVPFEWSMETPIEQQIFNARPALKPASERPEQVIGSLADQGNVQLSAKAPTGFVPGSILSPELANPKLRAKAEALRGKYPQYAEQYPDIGPPELIAKPPDPNNPGKFLTKGGKPVPYASMEEALAKDAEPGFFLEKKLTPEAKQFQKDRAAIQEDMDLHGYEPYFDPAKRSDVDPKHYGPFDDTGIAAAPKTAKTDAEWYAKYGSPEARARLQEGFKSGQTVKDSNDWYFMAQLEKEYIKELGAKAGREAFKREFGDMMAATTGGQSPYNNFLMSQYANVMAKRGERMPERGYDLPFPIGGRFASGNIEQAQKYIDEGQKGFSSSQNPKRYDFSSAFQGNKNAFVIDEQMMNALEPGTNIPQWYGPATRVGREEAAKVGGGDMRVQDVGWAGLKKAKEEAASAKPTSMSHWGMQPGFTPFEYEGPMINHINRSIETTHRLTGMPREEIVRRGLIRKEIPMYGLGGLSVMGGLAAQDEYR